MTGEIPKKDDRPIAERLSDPDETTRIAALGEVLDFNPLPQELIDPISARLQDEDEDCCTLAMVALANAGASGLPHLLAALSPERPAAVRAFGAGTIARMEYDRTAAIPDLCRCLLDENQGLREQSSLALARIGAAAVPALSAALLRAAPDARIAVVQTLGQIGPPAKETLPTLKQLAAGQTTEFLVAIAGALVQISEDAKAGLSFLVSSAAAEPALREKIIEIIGSLGSILKEGSDSILPYLWDPAVDVRAVTALALARMWMEDAGRLPGKILDALVHALDDPEPKVRENAGIALSAFGPYAERAVPALERHIADPDAQAAAVALAAIDKIRR
jgi:HEAT repeat protein